MLAIYGSRAWKRTRRLVLERDGYACTVADLGPEEGSVLPCAGVLSVAHADRVEEILARGGNPFEPAECFTACARHHAEYDWMQRRRRELASAA